MKDIGYFFLLFLFSVHALALDLNEQQTTRLDILPQAKIFIDKTNMLTKEQLKESDFIVNDKKVLTLGYVPNYAVWVKFTLKNTTDKPLKKIIEYYYPETESVHFYDGKRMEQEGMWYMRADREHTNPHFEIMLEPHEEREFFIKAHAPITSLVVQLVLWNESDFIVHDFKHQTILFVFFSAILTLFFYNAMLLVFTRDITYFYYISYLLGMMVFQSIYLGLAQLYVLSNELSMFITKATLGYISLFVIPMILFVRAFLHTRRFPRLDLVFKAYLWLIPFIVVLSYDNLFFDQTIIAILIPLGLMMLYAGVYTYFHGQKQARYYLIGWTFLIIVLIFAILKSFGVVDVSQYIPYLNEIAFTFEALLFSIALAHRIRIINQQKEEASQKLIRLQQEEQTRLQKLVDEKTYSLKASLDEKELLYRELNHRVKNNLAMILSLINLQIVKTTQANTKQALEKTKGRIYSISQLYETLNLNESDKDLNTLHYFEDIVQNIQSTSIIQVDVFYDICCNLKVDHLIYCGLILNEVITNALKYAFKEHGEIRILLMEENSSIVLSIIDNGIGFDTTSNGSLGLNIVRTLVTKQLEGELKIESSPGSETKIEIRWSENG